MRYEISEIWKVSRSTAVPVRGRNILKTDLACQRIKEPAKKPVPFFGNVSCGSRVHQAAELQQFIVHVIDGVPDIPMVLSCPDEGTGNTDSTHCIQLVCVREDLCFQGFRPLCRAVPVCTYRVTDLPDTLPVVPDGKEVFFCHLCTCLLVGNTLFLLRRSPDVMKEGRRKQNGHIGMFLLPDQLAKGYDPHDMVHPVRTRAIQDFLDIPAHRFGNFIHGQQYSQLPVAPGGI